VVSHAQEGALRNFRSQFFRQAAFAWGARLPTLPSFSPSDIGSKALGTNCLRNR